MENLVEIVNRCKQNDPKAQEILFNSFSKSLYGICCRYLKNRDDAEDVLQDSFIKILLNINQYRGEGNFEGWMKRITVNTALTYLKEKQKIKFETADKLYIVDEPEEEIDQDIKAEYILECLNELPMGYRTIFNLYLIEGFSHKEIAEQLGIKEATSRSQYSKGRQYLIELINKKEEIKQKQWRAVSIMMSLLSASWTVLALSLAN
ncbi:MAG: sigma-70 family RNA polymerase sigma factor [Bacteroidia bacterium]|nr:sigma-70 family RNA polymerase sigma factor [Bacteroidia bacterium]